MPELCRFFGIIIRMYYNDHDPPHFHAVYGDDEALIGIDTLSIIRGEFASSSIGDGVKMGGVASRGIAAGLGVGPKRPYISAYRAARLVPGEE